MSTLNPTTAATMPDPVALAIEAHRAAWATLAQDLAEEDAASGEDGMSPTPVAAWDAASRAEEEAWNALLAIRPASADGLARMTRYIADIPRIQVLDDARDLVRNLAEASEAVRSPIAAAKPDPVFALIEVHRAAYAVWSPLATAWSETVGGSPEWDAAEAAQAEPGARETVAFDALLATRPTTAAGLWALTAYLPEAVRKVGLSTDSTEQAALDALRQSALQLGLVQASATTVPVPAHPDADLLALGLPFLAAWRDEGAADPTPDGVRSEAQARCSALADRIAALPATTPEGLGIKALAFACYSGGIGSPAEPMPEPHASSTASDDALLWQIQAGAAQILASGAGAGGEPPANAAAAPADQPSDPTATALDLSTCSLPQLARLYEALHGIYEHLGAAGQRPCFKAGGHMLTPAGEILDREADRIGAMLSDCAEAVAARTPSSDEDRDEALFVRVSHAMVSNGCISDRALMRDLVQSWGENGHIVTGAGR